MKSQFCCYELEQALHRFQTTCTRCILPVVLSEEAVPKRLKSMLTYWPLVNLNDNDEFLERITRILGELISLPTLLPGPPPPHPSRYHSGNKHVPSYQEYTIERRQMLNVCDNLTTISKCAVVYKIILLWLHTFDTLFQVLLCTLAPQ